MVDHSYLLLVRYPLKLKEVYLPNPVIPNFWVTVFQEPSFSEIKICMILALLDTLMNCQRLIDSLITRLKDQVIRHGQENMDTGLSNCVGGTYGANIITITAPECLKVNQYGRSCGHCVRLNQQ